MSARAILLAVVFSAIGLAKSGYAAPPVVTTIPAEAAVEDSSVVLDGNKPLGAGDTISFQIVEDKTDPVKIAVTDAGTLVVPYLGAVSVKGKSCAEAAEQIKKQLEATYYRPGHATVRLTLLSQKIGPPAKILVSGKVTTVGIVEVPAGQTITVSGAIVKAGGATQFGDLTKVKFTRKGKMTTINVKDILEKGRAELDVVCQDGDSIVVPAKLFTWN